MSSFEVKTLVLKDMRASELAEFYFHVLQEMQYCGDVATMVNDTLLNKFRLVRTELDFDLYTDKVSIRMSPKSSVWIESFSCDTIMSSIQRERFFNLASTSNLLSEEDHYEFVKARHFAVITNDHPGNLIIVANK